MVQKQQATNPREDSVNLVRALDMRVGLVLRQIRYCPKFEHYVIKRLNSRRTCHFEHRMARRPSTVSVTSLASSKALLESVRSQDAVSVLSPLASKLPLRVISRSGSLTSSKSQDDVVDFDPDELFAKYTITEVKARQAQLRYSIPHAH